MKENLHQIMGVINITPNSFSDGGLYNQTNSLFERVKHLRTWGVKIFDIGAESTAPFNAQISLEEELERFKTIFFPLVMQDIFNSDDTLSIDTYRYETFQTVYDFLLKQGFEGKIVWNDVSGIFNDGLFDFLINKTPHASYVYCHNHVPERLQTSQHMDFVQTYMSKAAFIDAVKNDFTTFIQKASDVDLLERIMIDPCFGFAKTGEQNFDLIRNLNQVLLHTQIPVVLGISRKSFLKKLCIENHPSMDQRAQLDGLTSFVIQKYFLKLEQRIFLHRLHEPAAMQYANSLHLIAR